MKISQILDKVDENQLYVPAFSARVRVNVGAACEFAGLTRSNTIAYDSFTRSGRVKQRLRGYRHRY